MEIEETLEEAAERYENENYNKYDNKYCKDAFIEGAKWQQEKSYSEEEVLEILKHYKKPILEFQKWFEQFKKK